MNNNETQTPVSGNLTSDLAARMLSEQASTIKITEDVVFISILDRIVQTPLHQVMSPTTLDGLIRWVSADAAVNQLLMAMAVQIKATIVFDTRLSYSEFLEGLVVCSGPSFPAKDDQGKPISVTHYPQLAAYESSTEQRLLTFNLFEWMVPFFLMVLHKGQIVSVIAASASKKTK